MASLFLLICQKFIIMKKILAFTLLIAFISCQKEKPAKDMLMLSGNIEGLKSGTLYVQKIQDTVLVPIDTIVFKGKSTFETQIKLNAPEMLYLYLDRGVTNSIDNNLQFFAEPGTIVINSSLEHFNSDAKITGSKNQELLEEYKKGTSQYINGNLDLIKKQFDALKKNPSADISKIEKKQQELVVSKYLYAVNFAVNHKDYEIAPYIAVFEIPDINTKYLDTIASSIPKNIANSLYGKKLNNLLKERKLMEK